MKKLTLNEFIENSQSKHQNKYDYSKVDYINGRTKVIIICPEHGEFEQLAKAHLRGDGCPKCSGNIPITTETFIIRANNAHNNKFNYDKTVYTGAKSKVTITCPIHGDFEQVAGDHLKGCGCNKCRLNKSIENEYIPDKKQLREYSIWKGIKNRTSNVNTDDAERYINRGITCCERWENSFEDFYHDMGKCPENFSIDRIDNELGYNPENCRWASAETQSKNRGSFNLIFTYNGETKVLKDWAKELNINYGTLRARIQRSGLSFEDAIKPDPFDKLIDLYGEKHTLKEWCVIYNIKYQTVINRIHKHKWSYERAITTKIQNKK